ncbi:phage head morphogenesis protein [Acetobacter thailandicus]|uniref:phage head morphogenesis protein n=1 Tax=Acetobacter thailandicus TaxID=1502842 RepID=UPI001BAB1526|nr:phage minor head protein [Acetobacter thailandicus]MBS0959790.1 hypothetical protein [Acetobacter thailandicus]
MSKLRCQSAQGKRLAPVRPSAAVQSRYYQAMHALLKQMQSEIVEEIRKAYRPVEPVIGADASPLALLRDIMEKLTSRWRRRYDKLSQKMAENVVKGAQKHSQTAFMAELKRHGFTVEFKPSRLVQNMVTSAINENVRLIKGMSEDHLKGINSAVNISVMNGRDLSSLTDALEKQYGVSRRRAAFIARDQNNKATATINRVRQMELGLTEAIWVHSTAGKVPRPSHVKAGKDKLRYDLKKGAYIDEKWIHPGELCNCRCVSSVIIPGFDD